MAVLLLNDWVLKGTIGGWVTGKLSDVAGLFAFSLFWAAVLPRRRNTTFLVTAIGFLIWKSPLSNAPLAAWNALEFWPLARVIDYTDWMALVILLPAYRLTRRYDAGLSEPLRLRQRVGTVASAGLAVVAFTATSVAPPRHNLDDPTEHRVPATRSEVRRGLFALELHVIDWTDSGDTLMVYIRHPPERFIGVRFALHEADSAETVLRLLDVSTHGPTPNIESVRRAFRDQVLERLRQWLVRSRNPDG